MNKRFLSLVGVAAVLSVGTYVLLNVVKPHTVEHVKVAETFAADQVFSHSIDNPEPETAADAAAMPTEAAPAAPAEAAPATPAPAADSAATAVAPPSDASETAGNESQPAAPAEAPANEQPAAETQTAAAEPAATAPAEAAPEAPAPAAAATAEPSTPEPAAVAPVKPAKAKAKPAAPVKHAAAPASSGKATAGNAWWPKEDPSKLSMVYAGSASFKPAIVLMFNGAFFKLDSVNSNIKVTDAHGKPVSGNWQAGENNLRMLVFAVPAKGSYKVSVGAGLTDNKGRKLAKSLSGPVQVR